ncbi:MAG TPA: precorrin-4 C(11)-methyltransferase [Dehalococcoidia bacterium]|nr:precorrin-4 C(11)-methyltransferase [Dehalococcoidia bacterium]
MTDTQGKVYIVGGGPGDPELLTLKAKRVIETADVVIFADSLVPPEVVEFAKEGAQVHGSKDLNLDEIMELELSAVREGKTVARVQSGDPSIYGAILEQMRILDQEGVEFEIIPGVSAAFAAAAVLKSELTVPEKAQTIIMTRMEGRVAMPPGEKLKDLAAHGCTLVIFLSITRMTQVVRELTSSGYTEDSPVAVVYRVGWPDQKVIRGTLKDIADKVRAAKITLQALIIVGDAVDPEQHVAGAVSHLYSSEYTHRYRRGQEAVTGTQASGNGEG